jgi:amino acid adenylation domain-containing protein
MVACFQNAVLALLEPTVRMKSCMASLLPKNIKKMLKHIGGCSNPSTRVGSVSTDLVTLFEAAAKGRPNDLAITRENAWMTYAELNLAANHIAALISRTLSKGSVVCVHADRSLNWIVAIYGVLKAGAVYSPMDPKLPTHLRDENCRAADAVMFLVPYAKDVKMKPSVCGSVLAIDELLAMPQKEKFPPRTKPEPSAGAYVCFTSGSTGKPKGVVCTHQGLVAFQSDPKVRLLAEPGIRVAQIMSPAFDGSVHEIFSALSYGASLILPIEGNNFEHLKHVDSAIITPSIARIIGPDEHPNLKALYMCGESVPQSVNDTWAAQKVVYNMYGPTEGTGGATIQRLLPGKPVVVGRPNPSSRVYILGHRGQLLPPGVIGEVCIAGIQIAKGYIARPEETARRFVPDFVCPEFDEMMYQTGDCGYWNQYGELNLLGRRDRQIKLRGFRMDLNDLETRIARTLPEAKAVAVARSGDHLVAMVQPASLDVVQAKIRCEGALPTHCVPRYIVAVDSLPATPIGKVDYGAISSAAGSFPSQPVPSRGLYTPTEKEVEKVWREVLGLNSNIDLTVESNFLSLGGHSVLQMLVASKLSKTMGKPVDLRLINTRHTLGALASSIDALGEADRCSALDMNSDVLHDSRNTRISLMEEYWWRRYQHGSGSSPFNLSFAYNVDYTIVDRNRLVNTWNTVLARHPIFRDRFIVNSCGEIDRLAVQCAPKVRVVDEIDLSNFINRPFDLDRTWPIRVTVSHSRLVIAISHIVCDLTAFRVLLSEQQDLYFGKSLKHSPKKFEPSALPRHNASDHDLDFWASEFEDRTDAIFFGKYAVRRQAYSHGSSRAFKVPRETYQAVLAHSAKHGITLHQMALAAVALAASDGANVDITLGGPHLNRSIDEMETVALFLQPIPIRIRYSFEQSGTSTLSYCRAVQAASGISIARAVPWTRLLEHLGVEETLPDSALLSIMCTFHDNRCEKDGIPGVVPIMTWAQGAKFPLMLEFCAITDELCILRCEYDTGIFSTEETGNIVSHVISSLQGLLTDKTCDEVRMDIEAASSSSLILEEVLFGDEAGNL